MLTSTDVDFDPAAAIPELALLRTALGRRDWAAARAVLDVAQPTLRTQLVLAAHRSVWHADFRQAPGWVRVASVFAMLFSLVGDEPAARRLFVALGGVGSEYPWQYFNNPSEQFRVRRARALAQGERR